MTKFAADTRRRRISIHAPHEGERLSYLNNFFTEDKNFNPRSPRGGATYHSGLYGFPAAISIHAPHEGERPEFSHTVDRLGGISIHAPHEGERRLYAEGKLAEYIFQSTLPTRGSDKSRAIYIPKNYISIHAPHEGERLDLVMLLRFAAIVISIHAPHEGERRALNPDVHNYHRYFNPRSPRGGATALWH